MISRWLGVGMGWLWVWLVSPTAFGLKPLSDPTRPHAVLQCFDRFNIPTFKSDDCDPVIGDATVLIQLGVSGGSPPFAPIVGWRLKGGLADDPVRLAGVLEVRFSRSLSPSRIDETTREEVGRLRRAGCVTGEIHPAVPVAAGFWQIMESWLNGGKGTPEERARTACDLLIFARGYEAGGEPDMAKQLAEWALALMPEPDLHREAPRRLGEWMYQVAFDRWANGCGWERFADDLTDLGKKAPEGWPMLAGVRELAGAAQKAASALTEPEPGSLAGQLRRALLAPSSNSYHVHYGNWLICPPAQRQFQPPAHALDGFLDRGTELIPALAVLLDDLTPCQLASREGGSSHPKSPFLPPFADATLPHRPQRVGEVAWSYLEPVLLRPLPPGSGVEEARKSAHETYDALQGLDQDKCLIRIIEQGDWRHREAALYALQDRGFSGDWARIETALANAQREASGLLGTTRQYASLRRRAARTWVESLATGWNSADWLLAPDVLADLEKEMDRPTLQDVFGSWPRHRGRLPADSPLKAAVYCTTPSRLLAAILDASAESPHRGPDLLDFAMAFHRSVNRFGSGVESWPGEFHQLNNNREHLLEWIKDDTRLPIACRSRFDARFADTRSDHAAWLVLHYCDPNSGLGLRYDGYAALGAEWVDELRSAVRQRLGQPASNSTAWCRPFLAVTSPVDANAEDLLRALHEWPVAEFSDRWRSLSLAERTWLAQMPRDRLPDEVVARSFILRRQDGTRKWPINQPWISHDLESLADVLKSRMSNDRGVSCLLRLRSGAAGIHLEIEPLASTDEMTPQVQQALAEHFSKHPDAKQSFLIGSRRGTKSNTWIVDPSAPEWPKLINHLGTWFFDSPDRTLSQTSILLIGARRTLFDP